MVGTVTAEGFEESVGTVLMDILSAPEIMPGSDVSYALCKLLYVYLPIAAKMVEKPIEIAQSQRRKVSVPAGPEERLTEAYWAEWDALQADEKISNHVATSRMYGIASVAVLEEGVPPEKPLDFFKIADADISINLFDPLNTAGSLVLDQTPTSMDFQHVTEIRVGSQVYHKSRTCVIMNERPIYIDYTTSAFGFVGRSVYQRALFPLKSYLQTMLTNDLVTRKAGVLVAKLKPQGSIIDNLMQGFLGLKRAAIKMATTYNVLSIGNEESIESLDLTNLAQAFEMARKNILEDCASADNMPAILLTQESFATGLADGTEDAHQIVGYIDMFRRRMQPCYTFFDKLVMHRAWNEEFYAGIQADYPEYKNVPYKSAFYRWKNSFKAEWPSLIKEPDSEKIKVEEVKLDKLLAAFEVLNPLCDPENLAVLVKWVEDNFNELKMLFTSPLQLDYDKLAAFATEKAQQAKDAAAMLGHNGGPPLDGEESEDEPEKAGPLAVAKPVKKPTLVKA